MLEPLCSVVFLTLLHCEPLVFILKPVCIPSATSSGGATVLVVQKRNFLIQSPQCKYTGTLSSYLSVLTLVQIHNNSVLIPE